MCLVKCILKTVLSLIIIAGLILAAIFIGATVQKQKTKDSASLSSYYTNGRVCALKQSENSTLQYTTYNSADLATADGAPVAHCGDCGACSNLQDYRVFAKENQTLYDTIMPCALRAPAGSKYVQPCLEKKVNFTAPCRACYNSFLTCGIKRCGFSCAATSILRKAWVKNNVTNDCLFCTEKMCGKDLLLCSGADRPRLNIPSELKRPSEEMCNATSVDWSTYNYNSNPKMFKIWIQAN